MEAPTPSEVVADNIRRLRHQRDLTRKELADRINRYLANDDAWTEAVVVNVEGRKGRTLRALTPDELVAVSRAFGVSVITLMLPADPDQPVRLGAVGALNPEEYGWLAFHIPAGFIKRGQLDDFRDEVGYRAFKRHMDVVLDEWASLVVERNQEGIDETIEHPGRPIRGHLERWEVVREARLRAQKQAPPDIREWFEQGPGVIDEATLERWGRKWELEREREDEDDLVQRMRRMGLPEEEIERVVAQNRESSAALRDYMDRSTARGGIEDGDDQED